jgi:hypothetical protein
MSPTTKNEIAVERVVIMRLPPHFGRVESNILA